MKIDLLSKSPQKSLSRPQNIRVSNLKQDIYFFLPYFPIFGLIFMKISPKCRANEEIHIIIIGFLIENVINFGKFCIV